MRARIQHPDSARPGDLSPSRLGEVLLAAVAPWSTVLAFCDASLENKTKEIEQKVSDHK